MCELLFRVCNELNEPYMQKKTSITVPVQVKYYLHKFITIKTESILNTILLLYNSESHARPISAHQFLLLSSVFL